MYPLNPAKVYVLDRVQDDPRCVARVERLVAGLAEPPPEIGVITEENLPDAVAELQALWPPEAVPPGKVRMYMRPLVFTTQELRDEPPDLAPLIERCPKGTEGLVRQIMGRIDTVRQYHTRESDLKRNMVCWPTNDFGTMIGCPHGCLYCGSGKDGKCITIAVNSEDYMEQVVGPTIEANPWQKCFRMIGWGADHLPFEPENGLFDLFSRKLAEHDRYGYFHSASANVDWIAALPHRDRLIGVWSVTCDAVARQIEPGSGPAIERFEAARKCQEMGLPVRFKFKPIIPVRGWREEYAQAIEDMLRLTTPESVGFCVFIWHTYESMIRKLPIELLDPELAAAARDAADEMKGIETGPFPHRVRAEIYRFLIQQVRRWDKELPLYISTESREMWDEMEGELGQSKRAYLCGCSSVALPGRRLALSPECPCTTYPPPES